VLAQDEQSRCVGGDPGFHAKHYFSTMNTLVTSRKGRTTKVILSNNVLTKPKSRKPPSKRKAKRKVKHGRSLDLSPAGIAYQKCTLAPFDFNQGTGFVGIPDDYDGKVIVKTHLSISSLPSYTAGNDVYLVQLPIPGIAYFYGQRAAGSTGTLTLTAVEYDGNTTLFPAGNETANATSFRFASNVMEFMNSSNDMTWSGTIEVAKGKVALSTLLNSTTLGSGYADEPFIGGLAQICNSAKWESIFSIKDGAYCPSFNTEATHEWSDIDAGNNLARLSSNIALAPTTDRTIAFAGTNTVVGLGFMEAIVFKFPALAASQAGLIRTQACVEYQVNTSSLLYDYAHMSPPADYKSLALIKEYHKQIPCAVTFKHNASFWENFKLWAGRAAKLISYLPGPVGALGEAGKILLDDGHGLW
jgi:hypothetical protein